MASVKGNLKKLASVYDITPTKNTIPGILSEISVALGGSGDGKTVAEQIYNIALAKGYIDPEPSPEAEVWLVGDTYEDYDNIREFVLSNVGDIDHVTELNTNPQNYQVYLNGEELPHLSVYVHDPDRTVIWSDAETFEESTKDFRADKAGDDPVVGITTYYNATTLPTSVEVSVKAKSDSETVVKYTVTYNANGGMGSIDPVEVTAGESITLNDGSSLSYPDYGFAGWAKTSSAQNPTVNSPFTPVKDITLYAVWHETQQEI